ncbi:MAG: universal stress protein [Sedimenticola sp.]
MYNKIIVSLALDHGYGPRALELARKLRAEGGHIIAVHVFEPVNSSVSSYVPSEYGEKILKSSKEVIAERIGDQKDIEAVVISGHAGRAITDYAAEVDADCIVVGSHKPGLRDFFLGSTAARIVRYASCSVHVLR